MEQECGKAKKVILMLDSGRRVKPKASEYLPKPMEIVMRVNFINLLRMDKALKNFQVETFTRVTMLTANLMDLESIIGKTGVITKVISKKGCVAVMDYGKRVISIAINMKANFLIIEKKAMEFTHGIQDIFIKEATKITLGTDMDKCIGVTEVFTKEIGKWTDRTDKVNFLMDKIYRKACSKMDT